MSITHQSAIQLYLLNWGDERKTLLTYQVHINNLIIVSADSAHMPSLLNHEACKRVHARAGGGEVLGDMISETKAKEHQEHTIFQHTSRQTNLIVMHQQTY